MLSRPAELGELLDQVARTIEPGSGPA
jgi:hypothetical protein